MAGITAPLSGLRVLDFTWVFAGPAALRYLADYGATVVTVESSLRANGARTMRPFKDSIPGPERSGLFANLNAGKLCISINLNLAGSKELVHRLVRWADVVTESFAPGQMQRWGYGYEALRAVNPRIVMLSTSLNGQSGPERGLAGFGSMGAQLVGFGDLTGWPDRPPAGPFGAYTDYVAPKFIVAALLAAVDHQRRTGEGQYIDLSQVEASAHFLTPAILDYTVNGVSPTRVGNRDASSAPHGVYPALGDDTWVAISVGNDNEWTALAGACSAGGWAEDARFATAENRRSHQDELDALVGAWTSTRPVDEIERTLVNAGVPCHRVTTSFDALADEHLRAREHFHTIPMPEVGTVPVEASRLRLSETPAAAPVAAPYAGRDNEVVLREILGLTDDEVLRLATSGVLE